MILPTDAEKIAIKAAARRAFGRDDVRLVLSTDPIEAAAAVVPWDLAAYKPHVDARARNLLTAQAAAAIDRVVWCSPLDTASSTVDTLTATKNDPDPVRRVAVERLEAMHDAWPVLDERIERELRGIAGALPGGASYDARPLTLASRPKGLAATEALAMLEGAPRVGAGSLWAVASEPGLVLRAPQPATYLAARAAYHAAFVGDSGIIDSLLVIIRQLVVWSPEPFDALLERLPGLAEELATPFLRMGGSGAQTSSTFL
jgi:hypothetical protein